MNKKKKNDYFPNSISFYVLFISTFIVTVRFTKSNRVCLNIDIFFISVNYSSFNNKIIMLNLMR